jgi:dTMP kinase
LAGYFISFEGIEGCGKSTQAKVLFETLRSQDYRVILTREPGAGEIGEKIRNILLPISSVRLASMTELFLLMADRSQHVQTIIKPLLQQGYIVISDRFADSSEAYQGYGRGICVDFVRALNREAVQDVLPNLTFVIDLEEHRSLSRSQQRLKQQNMFDEEGRFETEAMDFHKNVRHGFLKIARDHPDRIVVLDGTKSIDEQKDIIWDIVNQKLADKNFDGN